MLSQDFSSFSGMQGQGEEDKNNELLKSSFPNSCFIRLVKGTPFPKPEKKKIPPTLKEAAEVLTSGVESSPELLKDKFKMSDKERASLEEATEYGVAVVNEKNLEMVESLPIISHMFIA